MVEERFEKKFLRKRNWAVGKENIYRPGKD
jgi:hypothetical protein